MSKSLSLKSAKIALVHDYLREYGGAERVLEKLHQMFPQAPVYLAFVDKKSLGKLAQKFINWPIKTTYLAKIPFITKIYSPLRLFAPHAFSRLDLSAFDLVISSANAYGAKSVYVPYGKHICYCHTPARSLYGYSTMSNWKKNFLVRIGGEIINHFLRIIDFKAAQKVDVFIANSKETQKRIMKFYRRKSVVIYPPVSLPKINKVLPKQDYFLYVNRLAWAKHPELVVDVFNQSGQKLKIVGIGPMLPKLQQLAKTNIEFLGSVSDIKLTNLYSQALALIYPVEDEDFGMIPVEAMMMGTPVIAHNSGGVKETVIDSVTGVLFNQLSTVGLSQALIKFSQLKLSSSQIKLHAKKFSADVFMSRISQIMAQEIE